jgi:hypothetical protein
MQETRVRPSLRICRWCKSTIVIGLCSMCDQPVCREHSHVTRQEIPRRILCDWDCHRKDEKRPRPSVKRHSSIDLNEVRRALGTGNFKRAGELLGPYRPARGDSMKGRPNSRQPL